MTNQRRICSIHGIDPKEQIKLNLNSQNITLNCGDNRHIKRALWRQHALRLHELMQDCVKGEDKVAKVKQMLTARGMSEVNARRLLRKFLLNSPHCEWVEVNGSSNQKVFSLRQDCVMFEGEYYAKAHMIYNMYDGGYIPKQARENREHCTVISPTRIEAVQDNNSAQTSGGWMHSMWVSHTVPAGRTISTPHGELTRVNCDHTSNVYLTADAMLDRALRSRYDSSYALENITSLLSRNSSRNLQGQPSLMDGEASVGIEVELDDITCDEDMVYEVTENLRSKLGWVGCVTAVGDGSLGSYGAEFVTGWGRPDTIANAVDDMLDELGLRKGKHCTNKCGVHVHVNREFFGSNANVAYVQWMVGHREFRPIVEKIAGRYNTNYCTADNTGRRTAQTTGGKYHAVNTEHSNTVEFRIFAAPSKKDSIKRYVAFCMASIEWVKSEPRLWTARAFKLWLVRQDKFRDLFIHLFGEDTEGIEAEAAAEEVPVLPLQPQVQAEAEYVQPPVPQPAPWVTDTPSGDTSALALLSAL